MAVGTTMKLSLILATVARSIDVGRFIHSLVGQTDRNFELIVVDQNTDDRLLPYIEEGRTAGLDLHHLRLNRPSLSGARNMGIAKSNGELVGFPDDDCWYDPDTVAQVLRVFSSTPNLQGIVACWEEQMRDKRVKPMIGNLSLKAWRDLRGGYASSISLFFRREQFDRLGGFDERLGVGRWYGGAEETDFILRALASGASLAYCPTVKVHHLFEPVTQDKLSKRCRVARRRSRGTGGIYAKHHLSFWVIFRGFLAPIYHTISYREALRLGFSISLGRIEGYLKWKFRER